MTRYAEFEKLKELTSLVKTERGYSKFIQTGRIEFGDYGRGFFDVDVYAFKNNRGEWHVRIWLGTIDDGDYGGFSDVTTEQDARDRVELIARDVLADMIAFPTTKELNERLRPYGIFVGYE